MYGEGYTNNYSIPKEGRRKFTHRPLEILNWNK